MAELQLELFQQKILKAVSQTTEPVTATDLERITKAKALNIGKTLVALARDELVSLVDKTKRTWQITDKGNEIAATIQLPPEKPPVITPTITPAIPTPITPVITPPTPSPQEEVRQPTAAPAVAPTPPAPEAPQTIVPSQATIFKEIGERIGVSPTPKKGEGAALDAIIYYVERTADMNNLTQVWNSVTNMGVPAHIVKRWITLYAQTLENKTIPEELKEKLDIIAEKDKVISGEKGEVAPKPKRFSVVAEQIVGDPEGDYDFNQAYKIWAREKQVPASQADPLGIALQAMVESSKEGPQTAIAMLTALTPFLTKETPKHDDAPLLTLMQAQQQAAQNQMQILQQMLMTATEEKHKAELESLRAEIRTGQKPPETETLRDAFTKEINTLKEALHQQQLDNEKRERERMAEQFQTQITELKQLVTATSQGKSVDSKIGLLDKTLDKGAQELSGVRQDIKGFAQMIMSKGELPPRRSPEEKRRFAEGVTKNIERAEDARKQAQELWGPPQS